MRRSRITTVALAALAAGWTLAAQACGGPRLAVQPTVPAAADIRLTLPVAEGSVRFAVIGDSGTGERAQYELARQMAVFHQQFPFAFVLMLGDNLYGGEDAEDYVDKFERPYQPLLQAGVKFYAALGNHDEPTQRNYKLFNMGGERYYTFTADNGDVRFFALDTAYMPPDQLEWLEEQLETADEDWKIAFFHHPIYSSGRRHGSDIELRRALEPLFVKHRVNVVFAGHDHFYERIKPQSGIYYFVSGAAGKLRRGNIRNASPLTAKGFDIDLHFMMVEIADDALHFEVISRVGKTVDCGMIPRLEPGALTEAPSDGATSSEETASPSAQAIPCPAS